MKIEEKICERYTTEINNPQIEKPNFETDERERRIVTMRQLVTDLNGNLAADKIVKQILRLKII